MLSEEDKAFCRKPRYLYEVAAYLSLDKKTLVVWLQDIEGFDYEGFFCSKRRLLSPKEVRVILENVV